ncbi:MAG: sugar phosphate isomerase/epimerase family protein [Kiritimatiellia bacterium]
MNKLSAFADEISQDLTEQIAVLKRNGIDNIELRSVWDKKVLNLTLAEVRQIKQQVQDAGMSFSSVGSPLGKFPLSGNLQEQLDATQKAIEIARILETPYIRIFSFRIPKDEDPAQHRSQIIDWLSAMIKEAEKGGVILAHENENGIYGDTGDRCRDLYETLPSPAFTGIFDFANFVQAGERPYTDCWCKLRKHITYFHIKDARLDDRAVVPPGMGDGDMQKILTEAYADGFDNFLTLEPHLFKANPAIGETSTQRFETATNALKQILSRIPQTTR